MDDPVASETTVMTIWPTIGAMAPGRWVGQLSGSRLGWGFFTLGKLLALATIPVSLTVFCWQLLPGVCRRYVLTNRRLLVKRGLKPVEERAVGLDGFDADRRRGSARPGLAARRRTGLSSRRQRSFSPLRRFPAGRLPAGLSEGAAGVAEFSRGNGPAGGRTNGLTARAYSTGGRRRTPLPRSKGSTALAGARRRPRSAPSAARRPPDWPAEKRGPPAGSWAGFRALPAVRRLPAAAARRRRLASVREHWRHRVPPGDGDDAAVSARCGFCAVCVASGYREMFVARATAITPSQAKAAAVRGTLFGPPRQTTERDKG